jgi:hypothetical protein
MTSSTQTITPLRQRMLDDMRMRKLSPKTQASYIRVVKRFAGFLERLRIPVKVATQSTGKLPPKPVKAATPSERSDAGGLFLLYLVSCRQICLLFSE